LPDLRQHRDDAFDIRDEAHVEHPVGLVDDEDLDVVEHQVAALEQIDQATGSRDQHVDPAVKLAHLVGERLAADQQRLRELVILAVDVERLGHLRGQFARGFQNERARHAGPGATRGQDVDHRQRERGRLARSRLRAAEHVAPLEDQGDRLLLNRRRARIALLLHGLQDIKSEAQIRKRHPP